MAGVTLTLWDEVLKTFYLPAVQEQLNNETILSKFIQRNEEDVSGKNATIEMHYGRNTGSGSRADAGALPTAGYQSFKTATVPMKYHYGRVQFTGPTIAATRDERGSYARVVDTEIRGMVTDLLKEDNRMLWGCGYGILAKWSVTSAATSYRLEKTYRGGVASGFGAAFGAKYLSENNAATPVVLTASSATTITFAVDTTSIAVSAIVDTGATYDVITCTDPGVTEANGTFYIRLASLGAQTTSGGHRYEMMGLRGIVTNTNLDDIALYCSATCYSAGTTNTDNLQGLDVGTYSWWKSIVDTHSSGRYQGQRPLTFELMQKVFDKVESKAGKDYGPDMILTTPAIRREYLKLCESQRRMVNTMQLDGGFTAIDYNGVPFTIDDDAIDGEVYFLTLKEFGLYRMSDYDWMSKDGAVLSRVSGYDAYEAILFRYSELGIKRRNAQGVLCDISYSN